MAAPAAIPAKDEAVSGAEGSDAPKVKAPTVVDGGRDRTVAEEYRERITKIYTEKQPAKLDEIDKFMEKYKGQEHILYLKVCKKYSVPEELEYKGNNPFGCGLSALGRKGSFSSPVTSPTSNKASVIESSSGLCTPPNPGGAIPAVAPKRVDDSSEGSALIKPTLSSNPLPVASLFGSQSNNTLVSGALGASLPAGNGIAKVQAPVLASVKEQTCGDGASARPRSRSPRKKQLQQAASPVWAVTYRCDFDDNQKQPLLSSSQARTVAVCSSKQLASAAAARAMVARKAELGSDQRSENFTEESLTSQEDVACGFKVTSKSSDGTEGRVGSCEWLLSSHVLE